MNSKAWKTGFVKQKSCANCWCMGFGKCDSGRWFCLKGVAGAAADLLRIRCKQAISDYNESLMPHLFVTVEQ